MQSQVGMCCGLTELGGLSSVKDPESALVDLICNNYDGFDNDDPKQLFRGSFILFTGAGRGKKPVAYAERFRKFIETQSLGTVRVTDAVKNTNSGNNVTLYIWQVNQAGLSAWYKKFNGDDESDTEW